MRKIIPYIAFFCLTGFTATSSFSVLASSCKSHTNKKVQMECDKDDTKCQTNKSEHIGIDKTVRS